VAAHAGARYMKPGMVQAGDPALLLLRHTVATLAYRAEKVLRDAPPGFGERRAGPGSRTATEILGHLGDLMDWAARMASGEHRWQAGAPADWPESRARFFRGLSALDAALAQPRPGALPLEVIFQGPIADAFTHVGQLALLRGLAQAPVRPESYARAQITVGRVGPEQSATRVEFDGDASRAR
jgi:hypothetical protein